MPCPLLQGLHKKVRDVLDDSPSASLAFVSTELRLPSHKDLLDDPQARREKQYMSIVRCW